MTKGKTKKRRKPEPITWHEQYSADDLAGVTCALATLRDAAEAMQIAAGAEMFRAKSMPEFGGLFWLAQQVLKEATQAQAELKSVLDGKND